VECVSPLRTRVRPGRILLYEKNAAAGIMRRTLDIMDKLLARSYQVISQCNCSIKREERKKKARERCGLALHKDVKEIQAVTVTELPTLPGEWEKGCLSCK